MKTVMLRKQNGFTYYSDPRVAYAVGLTEYLNEEPIDDPDDIDIYKQQMPALLHCDVISTNGIPFYTVVASNNETINGLTRYCEFCYAEEFVGLIVEDHINWPDVFGVWVDVED